MSQLAAVVDARAMSVRCGCGAYSRPVIRGSLAAVAVRLGVSCADALVMLRSAGAVSRPGDRWLLPCEVCGV